MTRLLPSGNPAPVFPDTAEDWFARLHAPDCTMQERAAFDAWLGKDAANGEAFAECERFWNARKLLAANASLLKASFADAGLSEHGRRKPRLRWKWQAGAALAAGIAALAWMAVLQNHNALDMEPGTVATNHGEQRQITLADGTTIDLNTDTLLVVQVDDRLRRVVLKRGEAFFNVSHDPQRPFTVQVGASEVRVVGTQFDVRKEANLLEVVVKEGTVNVVPVVAQSEKENSERVELTRGSSLEFDPMKNLVKVATVDADRSLIWRTGMIEFDHTSLENAVAEINRYASKPLSIEDDRLRTIQLSGGFRIGDIDAVLYALKERFNIEAVQQQDKVALMPAARP
jgi:transmembrane sensor